MIDSTITGITNSFDLMGLISQLPRLLLAMVVVYFGVKLSQKGAEIARNQIAEGSNDPLMTEFLYKSIKLVLNALVLMIGLHLAGLGGLAAGLLTAAGASAVIFGFAFKDIGENFISGVILSFNRPFRINDTIRIDDIFGQIKSMEFRYTKVKTFDGRDVYIPNSDVIKKPVFNYTEDGYCRMEFRVGVSYQERLAEAEQTILAAVSSTQGVINDDQHETLVFVDELQSNSVNLKIVFWVESIDYRKEAMQIRSNVIREVKKQLMQKGIDFSDVPQLNLITTASHSAL